MLDAFLEVVHGKTKQAEARERTEALLRRLPDRELLKVAYGGVSPAGCGGNESWLKQFEGTPLLDQAIAIEREDLELQMSDNERKRAEKDLRAQFGDFDAVWQQRDELNIKRKLLELELVGGGGPTTGEDLLGGQEGEDALPPGAAEEAGPPAPPAPPPAAAKGPIADELPEPGVNPFAGGDEGGEEDAGPPVPPKGPPKPKAEEGAPPAEEGGESEGGEEEGGGAPPFGGPPKDDKPKEDKPKTKITTVEKETEPKEKVDIKTSAARMRFALAVKEAAAGRAPFARLQRR